MVFLCICSGRFWTLPQSTSCQIAIPCCKDTSCVPLKIISTAPAFSGLCSPCKCCLDGDQLHQHNLAGILNPSHFLLNKENRWGNCSSTMTIALLTAPGVCHTFPCSFHRHILFSIHSDTDSQDLTFAYALGSELSTHTDLEVLPQSLTTTPLSNQNTHYFPLFPVLVST